MSIVAFRDVSDWAACILTGSAHPIGDSLGLAPDDLSPNRNWREIDEDGNARGWILEQGVKRVGHNHYSSRAGNRPPGSTVPAIEEKPPRRETLVRQTPLPTALGEAFSALQPLLYGYTPQWVEEDASDLPKPPPPEVEIIAASKGGFPDDRYGIRVALKPKNGGRTMPSGFSYIESADMATGNYFRVYIADYLGGDAVEIEVYVTRPGTGGRPGTERLAESFDLYRASDKGYVTVKSYRDNGRRPATKDESGLGRPPEPLFRHVHGRFAVLTRPGLFHRQEGRYHFGIQIFNGRGWSLVGHMTGEKTVTGFTETITEQRTRPYTVDLFANEIQVADNPYVNGAKIHFLAGGDAPEPLRVGEDYYVRAVSGNSFRVSGTPNGALINLTSDGDGHLRGEVVRDVYRPYEKEEKAFWFVPPNLPPHYRWRPWVQFEPLNGGGITLLSGYHGPRNPEAGLRSFSRELRENDERRAVAFYGYAPDKEPSGLQWRFAENTAPELDESGIEPPDPEEGPQVEAVGPSYPDAPADYLVGVSDEDELGHETVISRTVKAVLGSNQTWRSKPILRTNMLRNAEGSERTSDGLVSDWFGMTATATATAAFADGILSLSAITSGGATLTPQPRSDKVPVGQDEDVTFLATMYASAPISGSFSGGTQYVVEHLDEAGTVIGTGGSTVLLTLTTTGLVTLKPNGYQIGPNGTTPWADGTTHYRVKLRPNPLGGAWNQNVSVRDMAASGGRVALRKFESLGPEVPVTFSPNAGVAYPGTSTHAVGPTPESESTPPAGDTPLFTTDFEDSAFTGWTQRSLPSGRVNATQAIGSSLGPGQSPIEGASSIRLSNQSTTSIAERWYSRNLGSNKTVHHLRWLDRLVQLPTKGELIRAAIYDQNGDGMIQVRYSSGGQMRMYRFKNDGTINTNFTVAMTGLQNGQNLDAEIGISGGNTTSGIIHTLVGLEGNPRTEVAKNSGLDFAGRYARVVWWGAVETDSAAKWDTIGDRIVGTNTGYVLTPELPTPVTPLVPDAPPISGGYRLFDSENQAINQWWWFNEAGVTLGDPLGGPRTRRPISVLPGRIYTQAVQLAWRHTSTSDSPVHQFGVILTGFDKAPLFIGSPFGPGPDATAVGRVGGTRSLATAMAESDAWAAEDFWQTFTVPALEDEFDPGYTEAWIVPVNAQKGVFCAQEHFFHPGNLTTQAARDAKRTYGRGTTGSATLIFDTYTPEGENAYEMMLRDRIESQGLVQSRADLPAGVELQNILWKASDTITELGSAVGVSDPTTLPDSRYRELSFDMAGDGVDGPEIGSGGAYVFVKPYQTMLLRADRSEFPGGTYVDGLEPTPPRRRYDIKEVQGNVIASARSREVRFLSEFTVGIFSEEAKLEIEATRPTDPLGAEAPFIGGEGTVYIIEPNQEITFETDQESQIIREAEEKLKRYVHGVAKIKGAKVIEEAPLGVGS